MSKQDSFLETSLVLHARSDMATIFLLLLDYGDLLFINASVNTLKEIGLGVPLCFTLYSW